MPQRGAEGLTTIIPAVFRLLTNKEVTLPAFSITSALPSLMNGGKDFSAWSKKDDLIYKTLRLPVETVLGRDGDKAWRKRLMAAVRTQAAFYPHFLEPRLAPGEELTPTELQILHLLCADKSNAEIAQIMDVKLPTVKTHVSHILDKLDVKRRAEAKTAAKKLHLVPEEL